MRRRSALHLVATATIPFAGCSLGTDPAGSARTRTAQPAASTETPTGAYDLGRTVPVSGVGTVAVESATVQRSIVDHHLWRELSEPADGQVLVFRVAGPDGTELAFAPRLDGTLRADAAMLGLESQYAALVVPVRAVETAAIVLLAGDRPAWRVPASVREHMAVAPEFHLHEATLRTESGRTVLVLTVENRGDRDGTFRGIVVSAHHEDADGAVRFDVPAGKTVTRTVRDEIVANWDADAAFRRDIDPGTRRFAVASR